MAALCRSLLRIQRWGLRLSARLKAVHAARSVCTADRGCLCVPFLPCLDTWAALLLIPCVCLAAQGHSACYVCLTLLLVLSALPTCAYHFCR